MKTLDRHAYCDPYGPMCRETIKAVMERVHDLGGSINGASSYGVQINIWEMVTLVQLTGRVRIFIRTHRVRYEHNMIRLSVLRSEDSDANCHPVSPVPGGTYTMCGCRMKPWSRSAWAEHAPV